MLTPAGLADYMRDLSRLLRVLAPRASYPDPPTCVTLQDWQIYAISLTTWNARVLVPRRSKAEKPLEGCLMAVSGVSAGQ